MKRNLVPPAHFESDSLNPSPQSSSKNISNFSVSTKEPKQTPSSNTLKTPNDFSLPKQTSCQQLFSSQVERSPFFNSPQHGFATSSDSGFDWEQSKGDFVVPGRRGTNEDLLKLFNEVKRENQVLQDAIKNKASEKDSSCNYNIITHQVQYIERLQQDLAASASKLNTSESCLSKLNLQLQEAEFQIKQKDLRLGELTTELMDEKAVAAKLSNCMSDLKLALSTSVEEQKKAYQDNKINVCNMEKKHEAELKAAHDQYKEQHQQIQIQFESGKSAWEEKVCKEKEEWKAELHALTIDCERKLVNQKQEMELILNDHKTQKQKLNNELLDLQSDKEKLNETISSLQSQLENNDKRMKEIEDDSKTLTAQLQCEKESSSQLKAYIAQVQADDHAKEKWRSDKCEMQSSLNTLQQQKEEVEKALEMMNVRFQSVSKILQTQEESIVAHTSALPDLQRQNKAGVVMSMWRSKVFELMVHCKTQEIVSREEFSKHKHLVQDLEDRLNEQRRVSDIEISRSNDLGAQLQYQQHLNQTLQGNNKNLQDDLDAWKEKCKEQNEAVLKLRDVVKTMSETYKQSYETSMTSCFERCLRMEQRLSFANNRVRTIQDLLKRKESMWRVRVQQATRNKDTESVAPKNVKDNPDLQMEILHLTKERDSLSQQLAHDASQFETTIKSMKKTESDDKQAIRNLEKQIIDNEEKIDRLTSELKSLDTKLEDEKYDKDCLHNELNEAKSSTKQDVENALEEAKQQHYQEIKQQENALNKVKRDLTKAVVALRQAERSSLRERNQLTEQLETEKSLFSKQEEKLKENIRSLQKDNYILMTTIRQEGLLSEVKSARTAPILEPEKEESPPKRVHFDDSPPVRDETILPSKVGDMNQMLQDLTDLSEMVLASSESD